MAQIKKLRVFILSTLTIIFVSACGGGNSSSDSGGQGSSGCSNPDLNASYLFVANSNSSDRFTARFSNNNTVSTDIDGQLNGTWAYVGNPPSQISLMLGVDTIAVNITANESCQVTQMTLTAPDGVAFTGTRR